MVEVTEVGDFMSDDEAADLGRGHDEPPAEPDAPLRRATSPPGTGIADRDRCRCDAGACRKLRDFDRKQVARSRSKVELDPAFEYTPDFKLWAVWGGNWISNPVVY